MMRRMQRQDQCRGMRTSCGSLTLRHSHIVIRWLWTNSFTKAYHHGSPQIKLQGKLEKGSLGFVMAILQNFTIYSLTDQTQAEYPHSHMWQSINLCDMTLWNWNFPLINIFNLNCGCYFGPLVEMVHSNCYFWYIILSQTLTITFK